MREESYVVKIMIGLMFTAIIYVPFCILIFILRFIGKENKAYSKIFSFFINYAMWPIGATLLLSFFSIEGMIKGVFTTMIYTIWKVTKASKTLNIVRDSVQIQIQSVREKKCPWCAEIIQLEAKYCKHCHRDLVEA